MSLSRLATIARRRRIGANRFDRAAVPIVAAAALTLVGLAGCSAGDDTPAEAAPSSSGPSSSSPSAGNSSGGTSAVGVTLTGGGAADVCTLDNTSAKAGPVTFTVTNQSSTAITEVELLNDQRIVGEKENLAPGLQPVKFTVTLGGGDYQIYCPGAKNELQKFTVTGKAAAQPTGSANQVLADGTKQYGKYVDGQVAAMVTAVGTLKQAVDDGDLAASKQAYAKARPYYERIESDVDGFVLPGYKATDNHGNLDYLIDMRKSNLDPAVGWHGFHAVERDVFGRGRITPSTKKLAAELNTNVGKLSNLVTGLSYQPEDLANGAAGLLEEVQGNKIKGEEEAFSHIDLVDFAGNVEGAEQSFAFLKPGLEKIDPDLTKQVAQRFASTQAMLDKYRDPDALGGYRVYTASLRDKDANQLSQNVQALQDPVSRLAEKVATA